MPRRDNLVAGRAGAANKLKKKKPSAKTLKVYARAAAAAERKAVAAEVVAAEAKEGALGADAIEAASQEAFWARKRAAEASAKLAAASAPSERHAARCRLGHEARINGTVKPVDPSSADLEALGVAEAGLTVEEAALQAMREQKRGWVCALLVKGRLRVYLAGDLEGDDPWIQKVVVGKESERVYVAKEQLESQRMVVLSR